MSVESVTELGVARLGMTPSPIYGDRILEGTPVARNSVLSSSADGAASTVMWDCTAGRFNWFYDGDETIYVIEGSVIIKDGAGVARRLSAGDTIFFPAGSRAEWHVENYIRKIAFCRTPLPRPLVFAKRGLKFLKRLMGVDGDSDAAIAVCCCISSELLSWTPYQPVAKLSVGCGDRLDNTLIEERNGHRYPVLVPRPIMSSRQLGRFDRLDI